MTNLQKAEAAIALNKVGWHLMRVSDRWVLGRDTLDPMKTEYGGVELSFNGNEWVCTGEFVAKTWGYSAEQALNSWKAELDKMEKIVFD